MREHGCRRRVGEVVRGHVDRLDRGDRSLARGGDPLLELAHLGLQGRLVADRGGHPAEQRRDLGAGLDEPEDVVDEEQHVLAALLAEVLRHGQPGEGDPQAGARRLVHLAEDQHRLVDDAGLLHLEPEVVALARALADAAEGGEALVLLGDGADQLLDQNGLADAGAAEQADLAALGVGGQQVHDLDPGLQHLLGGGEVLDLGGGAVNRPALPFCELRALVDRLAEQVEDAAQGLIADRHRDRPAGVEHLVAALDAVGRVHGDRPDAVVAEVLLHLADQPSLGSPALGRDVDLQRVEDLRDVVGEDDVDDDAGHLLDGAHLSIRVSVVSHSSPSRLSSL